MKEIRKVKKIGTNASADISMAAKTPIPVIIPFPTLRLRRFAAILFFSLAKKAAQASSVSDVIGSKATDKILHPFAVKDRKRDKKHAQDRKLLEEYERLGRVKTFEELLDEAIRKQAIEDGKEPPVQSGKK